MELMGKIEQGKEDGIRDDGALDGHDAGIDEQAVWVDCGVWGQVDLP